MTSNNTCSIEFLKAPGIEWMEEIKQIFREYSQSLGIDLAFQNFETELDSLPGKYSPPDGIIILVLVDHHVAGCGALRKISEDTCEMKRLYVRDSCRMFGIGRSLISQIIDEALKHGYRFIRLDTLPTMKKAQELYREFGFYDIAPYVYNPIEGTRFMELKLKD